MPDLAHPCASRKGRLTGLVPGFELWPPLPAFLHSWREGSRQTSLQPWLLMDQALFLIDSVWRGHVAPHLTHVPALSGAWGWVVQLIEFPMGPDIWQQGNSGSTFMDPRAVAISTDTAPLPPHFQTPGELHFSHTVCTSIFHQLVLGEKQWFLCEKIWYSFAL